MSVDIQDNGKTESKAEGPSWLGTLAVVVVVIGTCFRVLPLFGSFEIDEIWTIRLIESLSNWWEVFTGLAVDNNHLLNSLIVFSLGSENSELFYRLPSFVFSLSLLILLYFDFRCASSVKQYRERIVILVLVALSYPFVLYGSAARGYSGALFGAVLAYVLQRNVLESKLSFQRGFVFFIAVSIALLSHLSAIQFYLALVIWGFLALYQQQRLQEFIRLHIIPFVFIFLPLLYYALKLPPGSGVLNNLMGSILSATSVSYGGPPLVGESIGFLFISLGFALVALGLLLTTIPVLWQIDRARVVFILLAAVVIPITALIILEPRTTAPRYFLMSFFAFYLLLAAAFATWFEKKAVLVCVLIALFSAGNLYSLYQFGQFNRGNARGVVKYLAENSSKNLIVIDSDHQFRHSAVLSFYAEKEGFGFQHRSSSCGEELPEWSPCTQTTEPAPWYLVHQLSSNEGRALYRVSSGNVKYRFKQSFHGAPLSGWRTDVYRIAEN